MIMFTLISCVMIVIILYTYYYLQEISQCPCFIANKKKELNVDYMKFYLLLDLVSLLLFMFYFIIKYKKVVNQIKRLLQRMYGYWRRCV